MKLSYIVITRNRRETLLRTLDRVRSATRLPRHQWEVFVVDNASDDDTASAVRQHRDVRLIRLEENEGMPARNHALARATGRYTVFLDDDSYPLDDAIPRALAYLNRHPATAGLVARVVLPDGRFEAPAFPAVTLGGASILRTAVVRQVGGFAPEFFRQAEEYDLSFRIWQAGHRIERFEDIRFGHDKVADATGRASALVHRMDLRNNLILVERYLPRALRRAYRRDFIRRYAALAAHDGHIGAASIALQEARIWAQREKAVGRKTLHPAVIEHLFDLKRQADLVGRWAGARGIKRVALADYSKNLFATYDACRRAGVKMTCLLENRPAFAGLRFRGVPVWCDADLHRAAMAPDGIVLSNVNPSQVDTRHAELRDRFPALPVLRLWEPRFMDASANPRRAADDADEDALGQEKYVA